MIQIKTQQEIQTMHEGGRILAQIIKELAKAVKPGVATKDLDKLARELVFKFGYPAALCTSINDEIVHGVPSSRKLEKGDLLKLDMGVLWKGFYTDSAVTVLVGSGLSLGKNNLLKKKLIRVTKEALDFGIKSHSPGVQHRI